LGVTPSGNYPNISPPFTSAIPPIPTSVDLDPGEGAFFTWKYKTTGVAGTIVDFDSNATATMADMGYQVNSNVATESIKLLVPDVSDIIVLTQDLLSRPEIFMNIPSPMGDVSAVPEKALWGINVVNPTGQDMFVSKVVISLISPRANSNDVMFDAASGAQECAPETVPPTPNNWTCPENNQLMWEDIASPVRIPPYSVFPFNALVHPNKLAGGSDSLSAVIVHGNVFTTVGEFGKAGYSTSFDNAMTSVVNVYLSSVVDSLNKNHIISNVTGIISGSPQTFTFKVVMADFEGGAHQIDAGGRLIINVPKGWTVNQASINGFGKFTTSYQSFGDTSSQIIGTLNAPLISGGVTIQFDATAPIVTNEQMYVMYILGDGGIDNDFFSIGPLQEAVLQVVPIP
jgi:hypothetical protein